LGAPACCAAIKADSPKGVRIVFVLNFEVGYVI